MAVNHYRAVLDMVKATIENLGLDGIRAGMVQIDKNWRGDGAITLNAGIVIGTSTEKHGNGNSEQWEVNYPAVITFGHGSGRAGEENLDKITLWRQEIYKAFDHKREPQAMYLEDDEVIKDICRVAFDPGWLDEAWKQNWDSGSMVVWSTVFITRFS